MCDTAGVCDSSPVLVAQVTDTHVVGPHAGTEPDVDNNARLSAAIASLNAEAVPVDVTLATGDLTNDGRPEEYAELEARFAELDGPLLVLSGNHDDRDQLRRSFAGTPWIDADHLSWVTAVGSVRLIGLDSTLPGRHGGHVDADRVAWIDGVLAEPHDGVTLLAMHHPPFESGIRWMDQHGFPGLELLHEVLAARPVDRIVCGHLHRPMTSTFAGIPAQVAMSTVQHVELDLRPDGQVAVIADPVGYQLHWIDGHRIVTHARFIETGATPTVPDWADEF